MALRAPLIFSRSRSLFLFSLFSVIFGLIGLIITLVWPCFSKTAVIFIDRVFINSAIYQRFESLEEEIDFYRGFLEDYYHDECVDEYIDF